MIGSPAARPDLFVWSAGHGHYHLKDFNEFLLFNASGSLATVGYKQAFCAIDIERIAPKATASGASTTATPTRASPPAGPTSTAPSSPASSSSSTGCRTATTRFNRRPTLNIVVGEDCFGDNTIWTGLRITGNTVQVIDPPFIPEDRIPFNRANVAASRSGGRWKVAEGNHWMLDTGTSQGEAERAGRDHQPLQARLDVLRRPPTLRRRLTDDVLAHRHRPRAVGQLPGEDCIPFDRANLAVVEIGGRWKVVEGTHWLLDFGPGKATPSPRCISSASTASTRSASSADPTRR